MPSAPEVRSGSVALLGGTGRSGPGLALHLARAGFDVVIGSRSPERAEEAAAAVRERAGAGARVRGLANPEAAAACSTALITVPLEGVADLLGSLSDELDGKVVISTIVPVTFVDRAPTLVEVEGGSAAQLVARLLPRARVTAALHTVSNRDLERRDDLEADVLICGDDEAALAETAAIVEGLPGARPVITGPLRLAHHCEALGVLLIAINRRHKAVTGVRITHLG